MITDLDKGWLAGIFDADGSLSRGVRRTGKKKGKITWGFRVAMTHKVTILKVSMLLMDLGISHQLREFDCRNASGHMVRVWAVESQKKASVIGLCETLGPLSVTKVDKMQQCIDELTRQV